MEIDLIENLSPNKRMIICVYFYTIYHLPYTNDSILPPFRVEMVEKLSIS